jgi:hypothetical protein
MEKQKVVKFILDHQTQFMKKGYNYLVEKETMNKYFINFGGVLIGYEKFYFMVVSE